MNKDELEHLLLDWKRWAEDAPREWDGWESSFPEFEALMDVAFEKVILSQPTQETLGLVEECFFISEETEDLADKLKWHARTLKSWLKSLSCAKHWQVRWQVAEICSETAPLGDSILLELLNDEDPYVRRRALDALYRVAHPSWRIHAEEMMRKDVDLRNRKAAETILEEPDE